MSGACGACAAPGGPLAFPLPRPLGRSSPSSSTRGGGSAISQGSRARWRRQPHNATASSGPSKLMALNEAGWPNTTCGSCTSIFTSGKVLCSVCSAGSSSLHRSAGNSNRTCTCLIPSAASPPPTGSPVTLSSRAMAALRVAKSPKINLKARSRCASVALAAEQIRSVSSKGGFSASSMDTKAKSLKRATLAPNFPTTVAASPCASSTRKGTSPFPMASASILARFMAASASLGSASRSSKCSELRTSAATNSLRVPCSRHRAASMGFRSLAKSFTRLCPAIPASGSRETWTSQPSSSMMARMRSPP
mmetsp:Transcript_17253/g.38187  ORF Transcript_17253/g.38187 Transcript_17253/m.38187 type:complete len:307 (+) Transcript_17253:329-1249(+)